MDKYGRFRPEPSQISALEIDFASVSSPYAPPSVAEGADRGIL